MGSIRARIVEAFWSYFAPSKRMDTNIPQLLFSPTLSTEVDLFFFTLWSGALLHGYPATNIKVTKLEYRKKKQPPGHEFVFMKAGGSEVSDPAGPSQLSLTKEASLIVERTVELDAAQLQDIVQDFFNHPDCKKVLSVVYDALTSIPTTILVAGVAAAVGGAPTAVVSVARSLSMASILSPSSSNTSSSLLSTNPISEPSSVVDCGSLNVFDIFHRLSEISVLRSASDSIKDCKPPVDAPADDRWVSGLRADTPAYADLEEERRAFHPLNLTVLHMALLVAIIHRQYPIYSLFKRNCFWFAAIIFYTAKILDKVLHRGTTEYPEDPEDPKFEIPEVSKGMLDMIFVLIFLCAPSALGRWMNFKVCEVKSMVVDRIIDLFLKELDDFERRVGHSF